MRYVLMLMLLGCSSLPETEVRVVADDARTDSPVLTESEYGSDVDAGSPYTVLDDAGLPVLIEAEYGLDGGVETATLPLLGEPDGGTTETWPYGATIYGESRWQADPSILMTWEETDTAGGERVLHLGRGQSGLGWKSVTNLRLDADRIIAFMTNGRTRIKLDDHPSGYQIFHLSEVPKLWFGNTLRMTAEFHYQGTNTNTALSEVGELLSIRGQAMEAKPSASSATGGDVLIRAGDASAAAGVSVPLDPGELLLSGGKVQSVTRGNIALHDPPSSWNGMEGGVYVHNVAALPIGSPFAGGYLFSYGGALYWHGSAGTVTMLAAP